MNDINFKKVPKFIYILVITIVVAVVFWLVIGQSLVTKAPEMLKEHEDTMMKITKYDNALAQEDAIEEEIKKNNTEYDRKQKELFIDLDTSSKEIESYCQKNNISLKNYNISEPTQDTLNRISSGGYPVYTVKINVSYDGTYDTTLDFLKYIEKTSKGCYYVDNCSLAQANEKAKDTYDVSLALTLYYYDTTQTTVVATPTEAATTEAK